MALAGFGIVFGIALLAIAGAPLEGARTKPA
jgi:hypothetical protein